MCVCVYECVCVSVCECSLLSAVEYPHALVFVCICTCVGGWGGGCVWVRGGVCGWWGGGLCVSLGTSPLFVVPTNKGDRCERGVEGGNTVLCVCVCLCVCARA